MWVGKSHVSCALLASKASIFSKIQHVTSNELIFLPILTLFRYSQYALLLYFISIASYVSDKNSLRISNMFKKWEITLLFGKYPLLL